MCGHMRLQVRMLCVGFSSSVSSSVCAEPWSEVCLSRFVCISLPHACLARRVVIGSVDASDSPEDFDSLVLVKKPNCCWKMRTILEQREEHSCPLFKKFSHFWSIVECRRSSTHMNIRVLSKAHQAMELLAFLREIAL